jgi:Zn-dependent peptidase ImmA (M78 family)
LPTEVYFNEFPTGEFNANARLVDDGALCLLNYGLVETLYNLSLCCCFPMRETQLGLKLTMEMEAKSDPRAVQAVSNAVAVIYGYLKGDHGRPYAFEEKFDPTPFLLASHIDRSMRLFVLAHELGHVCCNHLSRGKMRALGSAVDVCATRQDQEFEADLFAQNILLQLDQMIARHQSAVDFPFAL